MLDADLKTQLAAYLEKLQQPIELVASLDESAASRELDTLLGEIAALSPKISRAAGDDVRKPSFLIRRAGTDIQVGFAAIPLGLGLLVMMPVIMASVYVAYGEIFFRS